MFAKKELHGKSVALHLNGAVVAKINVNETTTLEGFEKENIYWKRIEPKWYAKQVEYIFGHNEVSSGKSKDK